MHFYFYNKLGPVLFIKNNKIFVKVLGYNSKMKEFIVIFYYIYIYISYAKNFWMNYYYIT